MIGEILAPLTTLAAVLVGGGITHQVQARSWRRDRRADAYATVITRIAELDREQDQIAFDGRRSELDYEDVVHLTEPLRSSVSLARLYASRKVDGHLLEILRTCFDLCDSKSDAQQEWYIASTNVRDAMREDLHGRRLGRSRAEGC